MRPAIPVKGMTSGVPPPLTGPHPYRAMSAPCPRRKGALAQEQMTKVYTSNWSNRQTQHMIRVRISLTMPKGCTVHESLMEAAPGWRDLLGPYKQGLISDAEYTRCYRALLEANKDRILEAFDAIVARHPDEDIVLLCWCKKGAFCHRRLLAQWLEEQGRGPIPEL